jgi:hypothetical protein
MDHKTDPRPDDLFAGQNTWTVALWAGGALAVVAGIAVYAGIQG